MRITHMVFVMMTSHLSRGKLEIIHAKRYVITESPLLLFFFLIRLQMRFTLFLK